MKETEVILSKTKKVCSILRIVAVIFFILFLVAYALYIGVGIYSQPFEAIAAPAFYAVVHGVAVETILILIILGLTDVKKGLSPVTYRQAKRFQIAGFIFLALITIELFIPVNLSVDLLSNADTSVIVEMDSTTETANFNVNNFLLALASFCLSFIFKYGVLLQQDSDDTV